MNRRQLEEAQAAGTSLAYAYSRDGGYADEVKVLRTQAPRRVYSGARWDFGGHKSTGVEIQFVTNGKTDVVAQTKLVGTWADYLTAQESLAEQKRSREQRLAQSKLTAELAAARSKAIYTFATGKKASSFDIEVRSNAHSDGRGRYTEATRYDVKFSADALSIVLGNTPPEPAAELVQKLAEAYFELEGVNSYSEPERYKVINDRLEALVVEAKEL